jgi:hypothetical protein
MSVLFPASVVAGMAGVILDGQKLKAIRVVAISLGLILFFHMPVVFLRW